MRRAGPPLATAVQHSVSMVAALSG
jgi:hypothetical protein